MPGNLQSSVASPTDPDDTSYSTDQSLRGSTSKLYTWNILEGSERLKPHVDTSWIINDMGVGHDLIDFRGCVVQEDGGLTEPYEKLVTRMQGLQKWNDPAQVLTRALSYNHYIKIFLTIAYDSTFYRALNRISERPSTLAGLQSPLS
ncbi:hypothetical protein BCR41DRAFT_392451 [Lobosporangium transversale]|uniref:Uncharacterized protein n=1 Tax=Lobosporangium transversale TaxID=64571 RepID=A0A1Y2H2R9_9FUNG|nr:hypothetical protein BCR41DRAFT_392451 [Lobosporangium transversale]ORZ27993.1 hypothetical protein BCR41DRAFT_392451 [Lobosporangium transversale]|eukprot:XP_021885696.1 hypothetical protein BCR41DRAFT_392451 [Lobosporangium transversale]